MLFRTAECSDDRQILDFLDSSPSDGSVQVHLRRGKSFFDSIEVFGDHSEVLLLEDEKENCLDGVGIYSERNAFVNGCSARLGFLSDLRLSERVQKRGYLARGYREIKKIMSRGEAPFSITTIMAGNEDAEKVLTSKRAGLPHYNRLEGYRTLFLGTRHNFFKKGDELVRRALPSDLEQLIEFYKRVGSERQFFPHLSADDFHNESGVLRELSISDVFIALDNDRIVGAVSLWDQMNFRQWYIAHYDKKVAVFRFFYNIYALLRGAPFFPAKKKKVNYKILSHYCIAENNANIFSSILHHIWSEKGAVTGLDLVMCGVTESDPLAAIFNFPLHQFKSSVYLVSWSDVEIPIDSRLPYVELGAL